MCIHLLDMKCIGYYYTRLFQIGNCNRECKSLENYLWKLCPKSWKHCLNILAPTSILSLVFEFKTFSDNWEPTYQFEVGSYKRLGLTAESMSRVCATITFIDFLKKMECGSVQQGCTDFSDLKSLLKISS